MAGRPRRNSVNHWPSAPESPPQLSRPVSESKRGFVARSRISVSAPDRAGLYLLFQRGSDSVALNLSYARNACEIQAPYMQCGLLTTSSNACLLGCKQRRHNKCRTMDANKGKTDQGGPTLTRHVCLEHATRSHCVDQEPLMGAGIAGCLSGVDAFRRALHECMCRSVAGSHIEKKKKSHVKVGLIVKRTLRVPLARASWHDP